MKRFTFRLFHFVLMTLILSLLPACELDLEQDEDASTATGVAIKSVNISCSVLDLAGCSGLNNGTTLRVGIIDDCDTFTSSSTIYSVAEASLSCTALLCDLNSNIESANFSPSTVTSGTYDLYAFFDIDNDDNPDASIEPIGCKKDVLIDGSVSTETITNWY